MQITLDLPDELFNRLQLFAHSKGRSVNVLVTEWIENYISNETANVTISPSADTPLPTAEKSSTPHSPQALLVPSNAGMRLIAQLSIFNKGDFNRLRDYISENFAPEALEFASAKARLVEFKAVYKMSGKMRINRVIAVDKHQALVVVEGERGDFYMIQVTVSEDYPHKVLICTFNKGSEE
ncbi:MAG: hypothetical protein GC179_28860 [Anaerolineaceae bacterium]|nr:hypothetical protein [Anaerolineaceae bacterium]